MKSFLNSIKNNQNYGKYISNTLWLFASKILSLFSTVFVGAWVARYLGTEDFGLLSYSNSLIALFLPLAMIGLNDIIIKELVVTTDKEKKSVVLGTALGLKIIFGIFSFLLVLIFVFLNNDVFNVKILTLIFSSFLLIQSLEIFDFYFQSKVKSKFVVYARICAIFISSILKILLIYLNAQVIYFAIVIVSELLIIHLITYLYFNKKKITVSINFYSKKYAKKLLKRSWPLFLSGLMYVFYIKIDQIMVKELLGAHSAGLYAVAINLSEVWYFIPNIIASSFFPAILLYKTKEESIYHRRIKNLYGVLFWISIFIAIFITIFGRFIIEFLYGNNFSGAYEILRIYIWSNIFFFFTTISSKWLVVEGFYLHSFYRNILGAILNVILNFFLIEKLGVVGGAISTLISYSFVGLFYDLLFKELRINFKLKIKSILHV